MATVTEIAWLAGLLEGDGSFFIENAPRGRKVPRLKVSMLDKDIIERVAKLLGCNVTAGKTPKGKPFYTASITKHVDLKPLLLALYPYMGLRRQGQINSMLSIIN